MKSKHSRTQSTRFLMPLLYNVKLTKDVKTFVFDSKFFANKWFINCYLVDEGQIAKENTIYLAYEIVISEEFEEFEEHLISHPSYVSNNNYDNKIVVYTFEIPLVYEREINLFKEGLYSEFSDRYKKEILYFWGHDFSDNNVMYSILFKTELVLNEVMRTQVEPLSTKESSEYWPRPNINDETFQLIKACTDWK